MKVVSRLGMLLTVAYIVAAGTAMAKDVDWATFNPMFKKAVYDKDPKACFECHDETPGPFSHTTHARASKSGKAPAADECNSCHGPRSTHTKDKNAGREFELTVTQQSDVCLQCHEGGNRKYWKNSQHASADVGCASCHDVMQKKSDRAMLSAAREDAVCYKCHANVRAEMNKSSHHPVREGKVSCSDCHNPHGSVTAGMLKGASVNDTCYACHQEKRGPFLWEHPAAREDCLSCHAPHGSNNRKLQNRKDSFLCLQCHAYGGHPNLPRYNRVSNPYGEGCVNCHMAIHGSNSPSGAKLTR